MLDHTAPTRQDVLLSILASRSMAIQRCVTSTGSLCPYLPRRSGRKDGNKASCLQKKQTTNSTILVISASFYV